MWTRLLLAAVVACADLGGLRVVRDQAAPGAAAAPRDERGRAVDHHAERPIRRHPVGLGRRAAGRERGRQLELDRLRQGGRDGRELRPDLGALEHGRAHGARRLEAPLGRGLPPAARRRRERLPEGGRERPHRLPPVPLVAVLREGRVQAERHRLQRVGHPELVLRRWPLPRHQERRVRCQEGVLDDRGGPLRGRLRRVRRHDGRAGTPTPRTSSGTRSSTSRTPAGWATRPPRPTRCFSGRPRSAG